MSRRNRLIRLFVLLVAAIMLLSACAASASGKKEDKPEVTEESLAMEAAQELADYINEYSQNALAMKLLADMDKMYEQYKDSF